MPEKFTIRNVPIVEAGEWHGGEVKISEQDLDEIVRNYEETKERMAPFIVLGSHTSKKKMEESDTGIPFFGALSNLRKEGKKLLADLVELPKVVHELISKGAYRRPSIELWKWKDTVADKVRDNFLAGVCILGAKHPAVNTLPLTIDGVAALYASAGDAEEERYIELEGPFELEEDPGKPKEGPEDGEGGEKEMPDDKLIEQLRNDKERVEKKLEAAEQANVELADGYKKQLDELDKKIVELEESLKSKEKAEAEAASKAKDEKIETFLEEQTKAGKLIPAQKDIYADRLKAAGDLDAEMTTMKAMFDELPKVVDIDGEHGEGEGEGAGDVSEQTVEMSEQRFKQSLVESGVRPPKDELCREFAEATANKEPGKITEGLEKSRDHLRASIRAEMRGA